MALHQQPSQPSKHWWPRKASTVGVRPNKSGSTSTHSHIHPNIVSDTLSNFDEKRPANISVSSSSKFDSLVYAIGLKSKKSAHSFVDVQEPPMPVLPHHHYPPRIRTTSAHTARTKVPVLSAPSPDAAMSSSTSHSWDESLEPTTPSDLSPRSSFYPSLLPSDPFRASSPRHFSALSDNSLLERQMRDLSIPPTSPRSSRTSASANSSFGYNASTDSRSTSSKAPSSGRHMPDANGQSAVHSSTVPPLPSLHISDVTKARSNRSATIPSSFAPQLDMSVPLGLPLSPTREQLSLVSPLDALARQTKLFETVASNSATSSPSVSTSSLSSHSQTVIGSKAGSTHSLLRRASSQRLRAAGLFPPSPAPTQDLPPTPIDGSSIISKRPSHALRSMSSTSLLDSSISNITEDLSSLILDVPASSSSSDDSRSLRSLSFVHDLDDLGPFSRATPSPPPASPLLKPTSHKSAKDAFYDDFETPGGWPATTSSTSYQDHNPTPRIMKKCVSQQSLNTRLRVDSSTSIASSAVSVASSAILAQGGLSSMQSPRDIRLAVNNTSPTSYSRLPHRAGSVAHTKVDRNAQQSPVQMRRNGSSATNTSMMSPSKKRTFFSSSGDRRDSVTLPDELRDRVELHSVSSYNADVSTLNERSKKGHSTGRGSGLGISLGLSFSTFSNAFSSALSSPTLDPTSSVQPASPTVSLTNQSASSIIDTYYVSHVKSPERLGEHILPPEELLRIEALVETDHPSPFVSLDDRVDETKVIEEENRYIKQRRKVDSTPSQSFTKDLKVSISASSSSPKQLLRSPVEYTVNGFSGSRHSSLTSRAATTPSSHRPRTAEPEAKNGQTRSTFTSFESVSPPMTGLPPPPRKRGNAVPSTRQQHVINAVVVQTVPASISRSNSRQIRKPPSNPSLQKHHSLLRKSSFLNIDEDIRDTEPVRIAFMPEDSFLELDRGKESLDFTF